MGIETNNLAGNWRSVYLQNGSLPCMRPCRSWWRSQSESTSKSDDFTSDAVYSGGFSWALPLGLEPHVSEKETW